MLPFWWSALAEPNSHHHPGWMHIIALQATEMQDTSQAQLFIFRYSPRFFFFLNLPCFVSQLRWRNIAIWECISHADDFVFGCFFPCIHNYQFWSYIFITIFLAAPVLCLELMCVYVQGYYEESVITSLASTKRCPTFCRACSSTAPCSAEIGMVKKAACTKWFPKS